MSETIYVEKNKSSRFGIYFQEGLQNWDEFAKENSFSDIALLCDKSECALEWKQFLKAKTEVLLEINAEEFVLCSQTAHNIQDFIETNADKTFVVLAENFLMNYLQEVIMTRFGSQKLTYVCVPVSPLAQFENFSIVPKVDEKGELVAKELLPIAVYMDTSILAKCSPHAFLEGMAGAFRLAVSYKANLFEWMISNLYELLDSEREGICELIERAMLVQKYRIEKNTALERSYPLFAEDIFKLIYEKKDLFSKADILSYAMITQAFLSWKTGHLSMEEYYEVRDMFVAFGLGISETEVSTDDWMCLLENAEKQSAIQIGTAVKDNVESPKKCFYIRKIGKMLLDDAPTKELYRDAFEQLYFNENEND